MKLVQRISILTNRLMEKELCPAFLNFDFRNYTFFHLLNDIFVGLRSFLLIMPIAIVFSIFSGGSPIQGLITVCVATSVSALIGGSKYQINSVSWVVSLIAVDIFTKYQYKGMLITALMVSIILFTYGRLRLGELLKYTSKTFLTAISVSISLIIIVIQTQVMLNIPIIYSYQNFNGHCRILFSGLRYITDTSLYLYLIFIGSLALLKIFFKNFSSYVIYLIAWGVLMYFDKSGVLSLPDLLSSVQTIGQSFFQDLNRDTIFNISISLPFAQSVYADLTLLAFAIALIIGCQVCSTVSVAESITGNNRIQTNMELISVGISNFLSIACGGLFVAPDNDITAQNIKNKSKSVITLLTVAIATYELLSLKDSIFQYIPALAISAVLTYMAIHILHQCLSSKYLKITNPDSQIFFLILLVSLEFSLVSAICIGIIISLIQFTDRLIKIKEPSVNSMKNHDSSTIEFLSNKYGYMSNKRIPNKIMKKIEVISLTGILSINNIERVVDTFISRGEFPSVIIIYFKNVPFFDNVAFESLKSFVKIIKEKNAIVMVTGTNGLLLEILRRKAKEYNFGNIFGYIIPNFSEAVNQALYRLSNARITDSGVTIFQKHKKYIKRS